MFFNHFESLSKISLLPVNWKIFCHLLSIHFASTFLEISSDSLFRSLNEQYKEKEFMERNESIFIYISNLQNFFDLRTKMAEKFFAVSRFLIIVRTQSLEKLIIGHCQHSIFISLRCKSFVNLFGSSIVSDLVLFTSSVVFCQGWGLSMCQFILFKSDKRSDCKRGQQEMHGIQSLLRLVLILVLVIWSNSSRTELSLSGHSVGDWNEIPEFHCLSELLREHFKSRS